MSVNLTTLKKGMKIGPDHCYAGAKDEVEEKGIISFELVETETEVHEGWNFVLDTDGDILWGEGLCGYLLEPINSDFIKTEVEEKIIERVVEKPVLTTKGFGKQVFAALPIKLEVSEPEQDEAIGAAIEAMVQHYVEENVKTFRVVRETGDGEVTHDISTPHKSFEKLLKLVNRGHNIYLVGPAGSFKTTAAKQVADALGVKFRAISLNNQLPESRIFGYMNSAGEYVGTTFREVYETGGVYLFDEMDNGNANTIAAINMAIENGQCPFPDKVVDIHPDARFICAANTFGRGADRMYVGRNQLDAASLDRFVTVEWDYDEDLERTIAQNDEWVDEVIKIRRAVEKARIRHVVSPRASITGSKLLADGFDKEDVLNMVVWKGLDEDTKARIRENME